MTIRNAKSRLEQKIKRKARLKRMLEYIVLWTIIILLVAVTVYPVQYLATKHCFEKLYKKENKTHVTIMLGGEKIILEDVDVVHIEEE